MQEEYVHVYNEKEDAGDDTPDPGSQNVPAAATKDWAEELLSDPKNRLALLTLSSNPINECLSTPSTVVRDRQIFNLRIPFEGAPVTNQRSSGRCWLFAATNVFRVAIMQRYKLKEFELSQAYLFFWDKLEKANYFLESILDTVDEPVDGRLTKSLMASPVGDGGQWDMVKALVIKYGLVPQTLYPDSFNAKNSSAMDQIITTKLREDALRLREMSKSNTLSRSTISKTKANMLHEIHSILTLMLGPPPNPSEEFKWTYYDRDGKYHSLKTTPLDFARELSSSNTVRACGGADVHRLFSLVNDPRNEYSRLLTVDRLGNVFGASAVTYVNTDSNTIKHAAIEMIRKGFPVFFGSDVGKQSDRFKGIMDTSLYQYELAFNIKLGMSKAERLISGESAMTHAMVLTAVHLEQGKPVRWRVENSWSEAAGTDGYFVMSDSWFDEYCYQAVVDPSCVSEELRKVLKQDPLVLPRWDPMGALA
ncbi:MAG: hypothetical protein M1821_002642 [Bathelium mastoideum]|nr:MAG: hypothetical protein M1821_002642 [Bathelium mastoideum]KAI9685497.1 MAG: hypothetical protein M1822_004355 [Bathelium mastoideum]